MILYGDDLSRSRRNLLKRLVWSFPAGLFLPSGSAWSAWRERRDIAIVTSDESEATRKVVLDIRSRFPRAQVADARSLFSKRSLIIAVGPAALRNVMMDGMEGPIVSIYTSSPIYQAIVQAAGVKRPPSTAIYAEPAPVAQLRLTQLIFRRSVRTAVLLSGRTAFLEYTMRRAAIAAKMPIVIESVGAEDSFGRALARTGECPAILAIPDNQVYTSENMRSILLMTYRNGQAVLGFSASLVRAGSLATTYSEVEEINAQLEEIVADYEATGHLWDPQFPKYFRTLVNEDVARSLNIVLEDDARHFEYLPEKR